MAKKIIDNIEKALNKIRPHLQMDGGDVAFVSFDEKSGEIKLKLQGACSHCPMSEVTLRDGIGRLLMEEFPEIKKVTSV